MRKKKLILKCQFSPGDIVMLTAAVRDLHRCYPRRFVTDVRTRCPELWEHNPYITPLREGAKGVRALECAYPLINQSDILPYHCLHGFIQFLNERLRLRIQPTVFRGDIHLSAREKYWYSQVRELTRRDIPFWIIGAGGKYDISIKWWDTARYQQVVDHFRGRIQFVQVGAAGHYHPRLNGVIDLRGQTDLRQLVRLMYHAQGVICPVTSLMHLAAAVEVKPPATTRPCVVIAGGREPVHWEAYPSHQFIHTLGSLPCCRERGCWKNRTFPLGDGDSRDRPAQLCVKVTGNLPRCMDLITAEDVIRRVEGYFAGGVCAYLTAPERRAARRGREKTIGNAYDQGPLNLHNARMACEQYIKTIPAYPGHYRGRGIVICGGGVKYFTNAWVCINMLRCLGCRLPVELWHIGPEELDAPMAALVAPLGVKCVDADKVREKHPVRRLGGWELKPYAMLHCAFAQLILLDADNVPVVNPEFLFESPEFKATSALFWPDYGRGAKADPIWHSCGATRPPELEFESGQIALDKRRCWPALNLSLWFNQHSDFYYQYIHGDKETFHLGFVKMASPYSLVPHPIHPLPATMCQHDFAGQRLFQHRNGAKWSLFNPNRTIPGFWHEAECLHYVEVLRRAWNSRVLARARQRLAH